MTTVNEHGHEQWDIVSSVGLTALAVAAGRSIDTHRADGLINDPYAEKFVRAAQSPVQMPTRPEESDKSDISWLWKFIGEHMGVRTKFFDQFFEQAVRNGATQAVILASGLDTRAFRLEWPSGFRCFEIDQSRVLEFKNQVLDQARANVRCERTCVRTDLREDWSTELVRAGFDENQPTAWLAEGLLPYLPADAEERLLKTMHQMSAPGSRIAIESGKFSEWLRDSWMSQVSESFGVDMQNLIHEDDDRARPDTVLQNMGWTTSIETMADAAPRYQRQLNPYTQDITQHHFFVTGELPS